MANGGDDNETWRAALIDTVQALLDLENSTKRVIVETRLKNEKEFGIKGAAALELLREAFGIDFGSLDETDSIEDYNLSLVQGTGARPIANPSPELAAAGFALGCVCFPFWGCFYW